MNVTAVHSRQDWFRTSPIPSNIMFASSIFFTGVAVTSVLLTKAIVSIALTSSATLVISALAVSTFALYLLLKPKVSPLTPFIQFPVDQKLLLDALLVTYLQPDKLYRLIFAENLHADEKIAYQTIPYEIRKEIEEQKKFLDVMSQEKAKQALRKVEHFDITISEQKEDQHKLKLKQEVLDQLTNEITHLRNEEVEGATWDHCLKIIQFNQTEIAKLLDEETHLIAENEEKRTQLLNTPSPHDELYETLRKNLCTHIHQLLSTWVFNNQFSH